MGAVYGLSLQTTSLMVTSIGGDNFRVIPCNRVICMGSPVSAVIANLVMEDVEQRALAIITGETFAFWKRYVDDVISAVSKNEVENLLLMEKPFKFG